MVRLSASAIKEYENCSFAFYGNYILKLPRSKHPKTSAGSVSHEIFELLSNPRHRKYVDSIIEDLKPSVADYPALYKLVVRLIKKEGLELEKWFSDVDNLITSGIKLDFYQEGNVFRYKPEHEFWIQTDKYLAHGFIDQAAKYEDENGQARIMVRDYKSQGFEFTKEELEFNIQALIYQYALHKETGLPVDVEFIMLRHGTKQEVKWQGENSLKGLRAYLDYMADFFEGFDLNKASSNFAAKDKSKWYKLGCITKQGQKKKNGDLFHCCAYKFPRTVYYVKDNTGKIKYSTESKKEILLKEGEYIETFKYGGCAYYFPENYE